MNNRIVFALAAVGVVLGLVAAWWFGRDISPPQMAPAGSPYLKSTYANGIVESAQDSGSNAALYPEVSGVVRKILVREGQDVAEGTALIEIDSSIQSATALQLDAQARAAQAQLLELQAQPRPETLAVVIAQAEAARATERTAHDSFLKIEAAYQADAGSVSRDSLDSARNTWLAAQAATAVAERQLALTRAGAWKYDIDNQREQAEATRRAAESAHALLSKYVLRAGAPGKVLQINAGVGASVTPTGVLDQYTGGMDPVIVLGTAGSNLQVRCYVDEILIAKLPDLSHLKATMVVRGSDERVALAFDRIQPLVSPKIELSDQRAERVDVRVLPLVFHLAGAPPHNLYPGQLVDVYLGAE